VKVGNITDEFLIGIDIQFESAALPEYSLSFLRPIPEIGLRHFLLKLQDFRALLLRIKDNPLSGVLSLQSLSNHRAVPQASLSPTSNLLP
jgi:hypothetical protein